MNLVSTLFPLCPYKQDRYGCFVPDFVDGAAEKEVADQPVPVGCHRDEIAFFIASSFENFLGRIAQRKFERDRQSFVAQFAGGFFQIMPVIAHFFGLGELQPIIISRHPTVRNVHQQKLRAKLPRQVADVWDEAVVGTAVFKRYEDFAIHGRVL